MAKRVQLIFKAAVVLACLAGIAPTAQAEYKAAPQVRLSWESFAGGQDGPERVASLEKAIAKMKSLDTSTDPVNFRRSWLYWSNIHGYYGPQSPDGTVQQRIQWLQNNNMGNYVQYYNGINNQVPPDQIASAVWATCQHGTPWFFGWHRMYLYYFEGVLRWAADDDTLRLPYWDYTDPAYLAMPMPYRDTTLAFYDPKRKSGFNAGTLTLDTNATNIDNTLNEGTFSTYQSSIEQTPHGYVHCAVGPTCPVADMGDVPLAGLDPVFYSHHANVDRMWACWQALNGKDSGTGFDKEYSFPNAEGVLKTGKISDFLDSTTLGYVYEQDKNCQRSKPHLMAESTAITSARTSIDLVRPEAAREAAAPVGRSKLVLRDITADSHPGTMYNVFLASKEDPSIRHHVGILSFFSQFSPSGHRHGAESSEPEKHTFEFDVTDELLLLAEDEDWTVEIEATTGVTPTDPTEQAAERFAAAEMHRPAANLVIGAIELVTEDD